MKCRCVFFILLMASVFSCSKKNQQQEILAEAIQEPVDYHTWYYLTSESFLQVTSPDAVPIQNEKAWTEALRISAMASSLGNGKNPPKAYALANRLGVIVFSERSIDLHADSKIFSDRTADNIFFQNDVPLFSLYKSSFFNTSLQNLGFQNLSSNEDLHLFLMQFNPENNVCYPVITCQNLGLNVLSEITEFIWDGSSFLCSVKTDDAEKTAFSYLSIQPKISLTSITPSNAEASIIISPATEANFREQVLPIDFSFAPERLQKTIPFAEGKISFYVKCATAGGVSRRNYAYIHSEDDKALLASAIIADTYTCVIFSDGTAFFTGALYGRHILQDSKVRTFILPRLPAGFSYGDFAITGAMLYVAWEETEFYKTGRSGFIAVDLDSVLYGAISENLK